MLNKSMQETGGLLMATEMRELRGKTSEELERLVIDYLDQQKILKLRQLLGAMRDGSVGPEAFDPRLGDVLRKYERRINALMTTRQGPTSSRLRTSTVPILFVKRHLLLLLVQSSLEVAAYGRGYFTSLRWCLALSRTFSAISFSVLKIYLLNIYLSTK